MVDNRRKQKRYEQSAQALEYGPVEDEEGDGFFLFKIMLVAAVGVLAWQIGSRLSDDALSMLIGIVFGAAASIPAALLVLAVGRRQERRGDERRQPNRPRQPEQWRDQSQPPVIVVTGGQSGYPPGQNAPHGPVQQMLPGNHPMAGLPNAGMASNRQFRVVGEADDWLDQDVQ